MFDKNRQRDDVKHALVDPHALVVALGLQDSAKRTQKGWEVLCPHHAERTPSCGVYVGTDGTIAVHCLGCQWSTNAIGLIAEVRGYSVRDAEQFRETLAVGAEIAGLHSLADEIRDGEQPDENRPEVQKPKPRPEPEFPPVLEVLDLWESAFRVCDDLVANEYLKGRAIDSLRVAKSDQLRVIGFETKRPTWAYHKGLPWLNTGHRLIARVWAADGTMRSVRAWQCDGRDYAKRVPPTGHRAKGLVLANNVAVAMLRGEKKPAQVVIAEGEPDWACYACRASDNEAVIGIGSGLWTEEHAKKIPNGTPVVIATDLDEAGERYAVEIVKTLNNRMPVWRLTA